MSETGFMLDTNVFDAVTKGRLAWTSGPTVFVTHVQRDELGRTRDADLRDRLLKVFAEIAAQSVATNTSVWDDTRWDEGCWSPEDGMYDRLLQRLTELDRASGKRLRDPMNQSRDARIAETAIKNDLTLVTDDRNLTQATTEAGGAAISLENFRALELS